MGSALFACAACGKKFRWKPEIAGKAGRCGCGSRLVAPSTPESAAVVAESFAPAQHVNVGAVAASLEAAQDVNVRAVAAIPVTVAPGLTRSDEPRIASLAKTTTADEDLYDIADDSRPPAARKESALHAAQMTVDPGHPLQRAVIPPMQCSDSPTKPPANSAMAFPAKRTFQPVLEEEITPALPKTLLETTACVALIALGVALTLLVVMRYGKDPVPLDRAVVQAGIQIVVNLGLMVAAIFVATYTIEDAFLDPWWRIILKTCAIGLCPDPIGQIIGAQIGDINGDVAKVFITVTLYVGLFLVLFRINILHTAGCVLVIWVIRTAVDYSLYKLEGMRSDSWI